MWQKIKIKILQRTRTKRLIFFILADIVIICLSCFLSFYLRFDGAIPSDYQALMYRYIFLATPILILIFFYRKLYSITWSFVSITELLRLFQSVVAGMLIIGTILFLLRDNPFFRGLPRSSIFTTGILVFLFANAIRFSKRLYFYGFRKNLQLIDKKVLIFGAGEAGEQLVRYIQTHRTHFPVGFVDDNEMKHGVSIHGVKVLGNRTKIKDIIHKYNVNELIIAVGAAPNQIVREAINNATAAGLKKIKILPTTNEILQGKVSLNNIRDISIEDLLGRNAVKIDTQAIQNFITNKTVLVTGSAGSIGSVLCHEILKFNPKRLIGLDNNETGIFYLDQEIKRLYPDRNTSFVIGNICDYHKMEKLFSDYKPAIVFHAAAYKHVPMLEHHPDEAVRNNILGTLNIGQAAIRNKTEKFVMISTDKAINPTSIMGASKRICEMIMVYLNKQNSTRFCAVRFGNVLGSRGSVIPIFQEQIKKGGPVEVTHPEMKRYFMVTSEACLLVMQAGTIGAGGEVFVLDMGEPIKICDLAKEMIRLAGYEPDVDIPIVYTGVRPGEKLFEEILTESEQPTKHEKIFISRLSNIDETKLTTSLAKFETNVKNCDKLELISIINEMVPINKPNTNQ